MTIESTEEEKHWLYKACESKAETVKIAFQMAIGIALLISILVKLFFLVYPPDQGIWSELAALHPLEVVITTGDRP